MSAVEATTRITGFTKVETVADNRNSAAISPSPGLAAIQPHDPSNSPSIYGRASYGTYFEVGDFCDTEYLAFDPGPGRVLSNYDRG